LKDTGQAKVEEIEAYLERCFPKHVVTRTVAHGEAAYAFRVRDDRGSTRHEVHASDGFLGRHAADEMQEVLSELQLFDELRHAGTALVHLDADGIRRGEDAMTDKHDGTRGVPGEGKGRRDEVGRTGIWPVSGPLPPASDVPIVGQDELTHGARQSVSSAMPAGASAFETDPVCGARINRAAAECGEHNGHAYYFDSIDCRRRFEEAPDRYATIPDLRRET